MLSEWLWFPLFAAFSLLSPKAGAAPLKLLIVGDSTVSQYSEAVSQGGWGQFIQAYFNDNVIVLNRAIGG